MCWLAGREHLFCCENNDGPDQHQCKLLARHFNELIDSTKHCNAPPHPHSGRAEILVKLSSFRKSFCDSMGKGFVASQDRQILNMNWRFAYCNGNPFPFLTNAQMHFHSADLGRSESNSIALEKKLLPVCDENKVIDSWQDVTVCRNFILGLRIWIGTKSLRQTFEVCTGTGKSTGPRLREWFRQVEAEVVSNSNNKLHQTWGSWISRPLYSSATAEF